MTMKTTTHVTPTATPSSERAKRRLLNAAQKTPDTLLIQYDNIRGGYDEETVEEMREQYGVNFITKQKKDTIFKRLFDAFINPFTVVLFILAGVSFVTDFILPAEEKDLTAVIIVVFAGLVAGRLLIIKEVGFALAVAVLIDATLVRMILVPATMSLLGRWNWWSPRALRQLHARIATRHQISA